MRISLTKITYYIPNHNNIHRVIARRKRKKKKKVKQPAKTTSILTKRVKQRYYLKKTLITKIG